MQNITNPELAFQFFNTRLRSSSEELWVAALDTSKKVIDAALIFKGTLDQCLFHPRDVFRFACLANASSILMAHNHPSGDCLPSPGDGIVTSDMLLACEVMQIPLADHLILGDDSYFSFAEAGLLELNKFRGWAH